MKKWWIAYIQKNQNSIALAVTLLAGLILFGILFSSPVPTVLDQGEYDLLLPKLGLRYTQEELESQKPHYSYRGLEHFDIGETPASALLLLKPEPSLVYPVTAVAAFCKVFHLTFSTRYLAAVLCALLLWAMYVALKALHVWIGDNTLFVGLAACLMLLCSDYVVLFNSLYPAGMFFVSFWLLAAALLRGFALCKAGRQKRFSILFPVLLAAVLFLTSNEQAALLCPAAAGMCIALLLACKKDGRQHRAWVECSLVAAVLIFCSGSFLARQNMAFHSVNLYNSFFDGVLVFSREPEETLEDFGLEKGFLQDQGKTYYEPEETFYLAPADPQAEERIFSHLSYPKIAFWYLTHPGSAVRGISDQLRNTRDNWRQLFIYAGDTVEDNQPVTGYDWWSALRMLVPRSLGLWVMVCAAGLGICIWLLRRREPVGWLIPCLLAAQGILLFFGIFVSGKVQSGRNLALFTYLSDFSLIFFLERGIRAGQRGIYYLLHPEGGARGSKPFPEKNEDYCSMPMPVWSRAKAWLQEQSAAVWEQMRQEVFFVRLATAAAVIIMGIVLFFPRIGAYNNGDFGRMMDAMQLTYTPEDFYNPEEQYTTKVVEQYRFLEPYDWSVIRPSRAMLSQAYISVFARSLYEITGLAFSTVTVTILYMVLLAFCFRQFMRSAHRLLGRWALAAGLGYILIFYGSYNLGWLNSLYGEGIGFVSLMLVASASMDLLERPRGKMGMAWLYYVGAAALFIGAKAQYVVSLPILLVWSCVLLWYHLPKGILAKGSVLLGAGLTLMAIIILGVHVYSENDKISSQDTLIQGLYNGILVVADDPEIALEELGLDKRLAADRGKNAYEDPSTYFCPPRTEMAEEMIYSKVSTVDYLIWYIRHPDKLLVMLDAAAQASAAPMPDYFLYVTDRVQDPDRRTVQKLALWQNLRPRLVPKWFGLYFVIFAVIFLSCFRMLWSRKMDFRRKGYIGLFLVFMLCGIFQYPLTVIGNGFSDNVKQIYLFREVWDGTVLVVLVWLGKEACQRFWPRLRLKKQKAADNF